MNLTELDALIHEVIVVSVGRFYVAPASQP